jgi:hypothetical protein
MKQRGNTTILGIGMALLALVVILNAYDIYKAQKDILANTKHDTKHLEQIHKGQTEKMAGIIKAHNNHTHKNEDLWALGEANVLALEEVGKLVKQTVGDIKAELNNHGQEIEALQPPTVQLSKSPVFMVAPLPDGKFKTIPVVIETDTGIVRLMLTGESTELKVLDRYPAQADKAKVGVK